MNLRAVDLNFLVVFEAMYQERNQPKAGKRLNMSQPAVSNSLKKLRTIFNDRLFVKTVEGMQPTPKAEKLAPLIHEVINQLKSIYSEFAEFQPKSSKQVFRLTMSDYSEFVILPDLLNRLEKSAPKFRLRFTTPNLMIGIDFYPQANSIWLFLVIILRILNRINSMFSFQQQKIFVNRACLMKESLSLQEKTIRK